jgi:hypothetical protein
MLAAGINVPRREDCSEQGVLITLADTDKEDGLELVSRLANLGFRIYGTSGTTRYLKSQGISALAVNKLSEGRPSIADLIVNGEFQLVINTISDDQRAEAEARLIRRQAVERNIPVITSLDTAMALVRAIEGGTGTASASVIELGEVLEAAQQHGRGTRQGGAQAGNS